MSAKTHEFYAAWGLLLILLLVLWGKITADMFFLVVAGVIAWCSALALLSRVKGWQQIQALLMLVVGLPGIALTLIEQNYDPLLNALTGNLLIVAMLIAVGFLRLIALPGEQNNKTRLPSGQRAVWQTLFGVHILGAVINLFAVILVADRLAKAGPVQRNQALVLSRAFAAAALWSPFFVAMGVALTYAPGSTLTPIVLGGLPLAIFALLVAGIQVIRDSNKSQDSQFLGYPIHLETIWLPMLLMAVVLLTHYMYPEIPILLEVTGFSLLFGVLGSVLIYRNNSINRLRKHVVEQLPSMAGELWLFLSAAVMAAGLAAIIQYYSVSVPISEFAAPQAFTVVLLAIAVSLLGVHPLITISTVGSILSSFEVDSNLLAITFLMCWSFGVVASPFSALNLSLQSRYGLSYQVFLKGNLTYLLILLPAALATLLIYSSLH